MIYRVKCFF